MVYSYTGSSGGSSLTRVFSKLEYWGVSDVLLPFLLVFTVVFAIMQKVHPLGKGEGNDDKKYNVIIALVLALAVIFPHILGYYPSNTDIVVIINNALPNVAIVLVAIVMVLLIVGLFGGKPEWGGKLSGWVAFIAFLLVIYIFGRAAGWFQYLPSWLYWLDDPDTQALIIVVAVFALILYFICREPKKKEDKEPLFKNWGELFGKGK